MNYIPIDLDASFISWFVKENFNGGCFDMFQHCLKFNNNNGAGIFVLSKFIIHGTLRFDLNSLSHIKFKLGVVLVNKGWLHIRLQHQLQDGTSTIWENNFGIQDHHGIVYHLNTAEFANDLNIIIIPHHNSDIFSLIYKINMQRIS
jgi:hypothetical protein